MPTTTCAGPNRFMRSLSAALVARGTPPEHVSMEVFGAEAVIAAGLSTAIGRPPQPTARREPARR